MKHAVDVAKLVCYLAIALAAGTIAWSTSKVTKDLHSVLTNSDTRLFRKGGLVDRLDATALHADKLVGEAAITAKAAAQASQDQQRFLKQENEEVLATLGHFNGMLTETGVNVRALVGDLHGVTSALTVDLQDLDPVIKSSNDAVQSLNKAIGDIDANYINDPDIKESLVRVASILKSTDLTAQDVQKMVHYLEDKVTAPPTKKQKILAILEMVYKAALIRVALGK